MGKAIHAEHLKKLHPLESQLKRAVTVGCVRDAEEAMRAIQSLLAPYGDHHRLLECRLWYFESLLDANQVAVAESGFHGIRKKAAENTRLYVEASFFVAVCYLRQKKILDAKLLFRRVLGELNKIKTSGTRQFLQKRIIERIEEEAILTELIGVDEGALRPDFVQQEAVKLVQKSEDEVLEFLGRSIPYRAFKLLGDVRADAILQLSIPDRKLLPAPGHASQELHVGKRAFAVLKRIGWKTVCDPKSPIFKMWSQKVPEVYSGGYFATAACQAFRDWRIGLPMLAAGVAAVIMKYAAHEFCVVARPESIMETRRNKTKRPQR